MVGKYVDSLTTHFEELSSEGRAQLSDEQLLGLLRSDSLRVTSEMVVFNHVRHCAAERQPIASDLYQARRRPYPHPVTMHACLVLPEAAYTALRCQAANLGALTSAGGAPGVS